MANEQSVVISWNANTEPDLASYFVRWGKVSGVWTSFVQVGTSETSITLNANNFSSDGVWYFTIQAQDTSSNLSAEATPQSKRIIRTANKIKVRV